MAREALESEEISILYPMAGPGGEQEGHTRNWRWHAYKATLTDSASKSQLDGVTVGVTLRL